jgi:hypothetical protein
MFWGATAENEKAYRKCQDSPQGRGKVISASAKPPESV